MMGKCLWIALIAGLLMACGGGGTSSAGGNGAVGGGGGGGGAGIDPRLARLDIYESQKQRVLGTPGAGVQGMPLTDDAHMAVTGTAQFDGSASIRVEASTPVILFGDASVTVDLGTGDVGGLLNGFFGTSGAVIADYAGALTVDGGTIGGASAGHLALEYSGALAGPTDTIIFDGSAEGHFLGNPIAAMSASDLEAEVLHNGTSRDATVVIVGEGTVVPVTID